jgi:hypothetical protein
MKTFKQYLDEKGRCWPGHKPVPGKKPYSPGSCMKEDHVEKLEMGLKKLNKHDYDTIDGLMKKISKEHNVSGKELHNDFMYKHGKTPDKWIKTIKESNAAAIAAATAISKKKSGDYDSKGFRKTAYKNPNNPNIKSNEQRRKELAEDLRKWFAQKWVRMDTKGNIKGQCARDPGEGKPKCLPQAKAQSLGQAGRAAAARRKRREDPNPERRGAPINVRTK